MIEYKAPNGELWRIESGESMLNQLGLDEFELGDWHEHFVGESKAWPICCRFYGISPVLWPEGKTKKDYEKWPIKRIAEELGLTMASVEREIEHAMANYRRAQTIRATSDPDKPAEGSGFISVGDDDGREDSYFAKPVEDMSDDEIDAELAKYNFGYLRDLSEKRTVVSRIAEMSHLLDDEQGRIMAKQAITMELEMEDISARMASLRSNTDKDKSLPSSYKTLQTDLNSLRTKYSSLMADLGAVETGNQSMRKKRAFKESYGALIRNYMEYISNPDNVLIDGMHTAGEIEVASRVYADRPAQLRPDVAVIAYYAKMHLWDKDWKGQPLSQKVVRFLIAARDKARELIDEGKPIVSLADTIAQASDVDDARAEMAATDVPDVGLQTGGESGAQENFEPDPNWGAAPGGGGGGFNKNDIAV